VEGWWSGSITYMGYLWNLFGDCQSLLAKLVITYADGTEETVVTDPNTWYYFNDGPITYSSNISRGGVRRPERDRDRGVGRSLVRPLWLGKKPGR